MSSVGTGYDLSTTTYSPDGRIYQTEYAYKAVENSGTAVGIRVSDGIVLGVEKLLHSKLLVPGSNRRIGFVDRHVGLATAGLLADGRRLANIAREEATNYRSFYRAPVPGRYLADRVGMYMQYFTTHPSVRPFGVCGILATHDPVKGYEMYMAEPSGVYFGYYGCAIGKGKQNAKTEIEKLDLENLTARQAIKEVAKIIHSVHDSVKDKDFELELSWICEETGRIHQLVPPELVKEAEDAAKAALQTGMDDD